MAKVKSILNLHEASTHQRLSAACREHGASAHIKMRVADVLPIERSGIDADLYRFALQSHFDFVICEGETPVFAVEFDGPSHKSARQRARDENKLALCRHFEFPLLRITAKYLPTIYRSYDLLSWCVDQWFLYRHLADAQARGDLPDDEPLDAMMILSLPGRKGNFPMWLSAEPRSKIQRIHREGRCHDFAPSEWIGRDDAGNYHGIMWLRLDSSRCVFAESAARAQLFPTMESELLSEVLAFELFRRLERILSGTEDAVSISEVDARIKSHSSKYRMACAFGVCGPAT